MAKTSIIAGEDDRTLPSQECGPRPGKKQQEKQQSKPNQNRARTGEKWALRAVQYRVNKKRSRTQRQ